MATRKEVKNRISSVKNVQKITRAMEMVAAARLRRAEQRIEQMRPYAQQIRKMTRNVAEAAGAASPTTDLRATSCLTKQYLETGAVMFKDTCTKEWAVNSTAMTEKAAASAGPACLTKENHPNGVVMFRDGCTNEWAMNTAEQVAQLPPAR